MKVTIEFQDGEGRDATYDAILALRAGEYRAALGGIDNALWRIQKYRELGEEARALLIEVIDIVTEQTNDLLED